MPEYHRGKARSMYRKRFLGVNITTNSAGVKVQAAVVGPNSGLVETKSWRGHALIVGKGETNGNVANGWVGWYRGQLVASAQEALPAGLFLAQSECIGVEPWTLGFNDLIIPMKLVGITLAVGENLYFVVGTHFRNGGTTFVNGAFAYAEKEVPA